MTVVIIYSKNMDLDQREECLHLRCDSIHCDKASWSSSELPSRAVRRMVLVFQSFSQISSLPSFMSIVTKYEVFCLLGLSL